MTGEEEHKFETIFRTIRQAETFFLREARHLAIPSIDRAIIRLQGLRKMAEDFDVDANREE